jgi:hypothetical protein
MKVNHDFVLSASDPQPPVELERHYSVAEVAEAWGLSPDTIRRHFENIPGVIRIGHAATKKKKKYVTLRIPARVLRAEHGRMAGRVA